MNAKQTCYFVLGVALAYAGVSWAQTYQQVPYLRVLQREELAASTTARASLNIAQGAAPTSPVNGDIWTTSSGVFARINGVTEGPFGDVSFPLLAPDGQADAPSYSFTNFPMSGLFFDGTTMVLGNDSDNDGPSLQLGAPGTMTATVLASAEDAGLNILAARQLRLSSDNGENVLISPNTGGITEIRGPADDTPSVQFTSPSAIIEFEPWSVDNIGEIRFLDSMGLDSVGRIVAVDGLELNAAGGNVQLTNAYVETSFGVNIDPTGSELMTFLGGPLNNGSGVMWGNPDGTGAEIMFIPNETGMDPDTRFFSVFAGVNGGNGQLGFGAPWGLPIELFSNAGGGSGIVAIGVPGTDYIEPRSNLRADSVNPLRLFSPLQADQFIEFNTDTLGEGLMSFNDGMAPMDGRIEAATLTLDGDVTITGTCTGCGAGSSPGGADGNVQYNDGGAFGGEAALSYNDTTDVLTTAGLVADPGGGSDELTVSSGAVAMIGTTSGGTSGGVDMTPATGTATASWANACTTTPTNNWSFTRVGNLVTIVPTTGITCTSDSTAFISDAFIPAEFRPTTTMLLGMIPVTNNGVDEIGCIQVGSTGVVTLFRSGGTGSCGVATWTASGFKSAYQSGNFATSYIKNN